MPTLKAGPVRDLKIDTGSYRVWVRRDSGQPAIIVYGRIPCRGQDEVIRERWEVIGTFRVRLSPLCQRLVRK